ncbi:MAG: hypothetical protein JO301_02215, partial [Chitinophagaceae bacterium]|nr:hypothetical protein [Chitinophagaceae bacterium]
MVLKKAMPAAAWLVLIGLAARILVWLLLASPAPLSAYSGGQRLFFEALTRHFGDYTGFTSQIPPLTLYIIAGVFKIVGIETALSMRVFTGLVGVLDIVAVWMAYDAAIRSGAGRRAAFFASLLFSLALIPFELWREGMHYDHYTVFFTAFFAWALSRVFRRQDTGSGIVVSIAGAL